MISCSTLIETMRLSCIVFEILRVILSKFADFNPPHLCQAPTLAVNLAEIFGTRRLPELSLGVVCVILRLAVSVEEFRLVTDRQTQAHSINTPLAQRRAVKYILQSKSHKMVIGRQWSGQTQECWNCEKSTCATDCLNRGNMEQKAQLSPSDRAMRLISNNLASYHATVQELLIRQVLTKPMV